MDSRSVEYIVNRHKFTEDMFAAAVPTDRPDPASADGGEQNRPTPPRVNNENPEGHTVHESTSLKNEDRAPRQNLLMSPANLTTVKNEKVPATPNDGNMPSTSGYISPKTIRPYPKTGARVQTSRKPIKRGKAAVLTNSPYKNALESELKKKQDKEPPAQKKTNVPKPTKNSGKGKSSAARLRPELEEGDESEMDDEDDREDEADSVCIYCDDLYSKSKSGEGWIQCSKCGKWAHDDCTGVDSEDDDFACVMRMQAS